ncbi:hypothetical protein LSAT2_015664 [Lamellibrachia satsuma]|nr:hypothetical protein LSAT2_015664 [Lamellibrachia satsuma]
MAAAESSDGAATSKVIFREVLPKLGLVHSEQISGWIMCKPKIMAMKSFTLQKMESLQKQAQETMMQINRDFPTENMVSFADKARLDTPAPLEGPEEEL